MVWKVIDGLAISTLVLVSTTGCGVAEIAGEISQATAMPEYRVEVSSVSWAGEPIPGADPASFQWLRDELNMTLPWGRDDHRGYYRNLVIPESDGSSFRAIDRQWAVDNKHVYFGAQSISGKRLVMWTAKGANVTVLPGADPASFRLLERHYTADDHQVFYRLTALPDSDPDTFRRLEGSQLWRDDRQLYYQDRRIETTIDGQTHAAIADEWKKMDGFYTDGKGVWTEYFYPVPDADPSTFVVLENGFSKDVNHVWHKRKLQPDFDAPSFRVNADRSIEDKSGKISIERDPRNVRTPTVYGRVKSEE